MLKLHTLKQVSILGGAVVVGGVGITMFLLRPPTNFLVDRNSIKYGLHTNIVPQEGYEGTNYQCLWTPLTGGLNANKSYIRHSIGMNSYDDATIGDNTID